MVIVRIINNDLIKLYDITLHFDNLAIIEKSIYEYVLLAAVYLSAQKCIFVYRVVTYNT